MLCTCVAGWTVVNEAGEECKHFWRPCVHTPRERDKNFFREHEFSFRSLVPHTDRNEPLSTHRVLRSLHARSRATLITAVARRTGRVSLFHLSPFRPVFRTYNYRVDYILDLERKLLSRMGPHFLYFTLLSRVTDEFRETILRVVQKVRISRQVDLPLHALLGGVDKGGHSTNESAQS